ncbi:MAG TPA: GspH/FimT family pseudopilin [Xanthomonadales bacterium]|nr:GspH/FimT family pseudopilin [Xanthomonadales bacterium]
MKKLNHGFTLLELVMVIAIAAIVLAGALPSMTQTIRNNTVASQNLSMVAMLKFARSEAIRRNTDVTMEFSASGNTWSAIVQDPNEETDVEGCNPGQLRCTSNTNVALQENPATLTFNSRGYFEVTAGEWSAAESMFLQHEYCSGQNQRTRINILPTGQVSSCSLPCDSTAVCQ